MGAAAAEAPLRLPAAPPLAFCCYTSVLLLFAFSLPGSRASNQPPGGGGGGDCPGGKGKSINCSGRTGQRASRRPLPSSLCPAAASLLVPATPPSQAPAWGSQDPGGGQGASAQCGLGDPRGAGEWLCVRPSVPSGCARAAGRVGRW